MKTNQYKRAQDLMGHANCLALCDALGACAFTAAGYKKYVADKKIETLILNNHSVAYIQRKTGLSRSTVWRKYKKFK